MMNKSYKELMLLSTFEERYEYLMLGGKVGSLTFGSDRYLNQALYNSREWRMFRKDIIVRDCGCDLAIQGRDIEKGGILHHINPVTIEMLERRDSIVLDPNNVILTTLNTHNAIHYGDASLLIRLPQERTKGDTKLW